jgi:hypothetical protein
MAHFNRVPGVGLGQGVVRTGHGRGRCLAREVSSLLFTGATAEGATGRCGSGWQNAVGVGVRMLIQRLSRLPWRAVGGEARVSLNAGPARTLAINSAFNRLLRLPGAAVADVSLAAAGVIVTAAYGAGDGSAQAAARSAVLDCVAGPTRPGWSRLIDCANWGRGRREELHDRTNAIRNCAPRSSPARHVEDLHASATHSYQARLATYSAPWAPARAGVRRQAHHAAPPPRISAQGAHRSTPRPDPTNLHGV